MFLAKSRDKIKYTQQRWGFGTKHAFQDQTWVGPCSTYVGLLGPPSLKVGTINLPESMEYYGIVKSRPVFSIRAKDENETTDQCMKLC